MVVLRAAHVTFIVVRVHAGAVQAVLIVLALLIGLLLLLSAQTAGIRLTPVFAAEHSRVLVDRIAARLAAVLLDRAPAVKVGVTALPG